jgi:hypothetical protein
MRSEDMDIACTSAGIKARSRLGFQTYPVKLKFIGGDGEVLPQAIFTVSKSDGANPSTVTCASSGILMRLRPGSYMARIDASDGPSKTVDFSVSVSARQKLVIVRFPSIMPGALSSGRPQKSPNRPNASPP